MTRAARGRGRDGGGGANASGRPTSKHVQERAVDYVRGPSDHGLDVEIGVPSRPPGASTDARPSPRRPRPRHAEWVRSVGRAGATRPARGGGVVARVAREGRAASAVPQREHSIGPRPDLPQPVEHLRIETAGVGATRCLLGPAVAGSVKRATDTREDPGRALRARLARGLFRASDCPRSSCPRRLNGRAGGPPRRQPARRDHALVDTPLASVLRRGP